MLRSEVTEISPLAVKLKGALAPRVAPRLALPVWFMYTDEGQPEPIAKVVVPLPMALVLTGAKALPIEP